MRFLVSGYYGFGNLGDDALLAIIATQLRARYPGAVIDALSAEPERTAAELGIVATPRWDQAAVRNAVAAADVVLSGGGGLFQNATSLKSLFYYAGIVRTALRSGKKTMVFAQSVGPLDFLGKQTLRECCRGLRSATVRDNASKTLFAPLVPAATVEVTADPVFVYDRPARPVDLEPAGFASNSDPLVLVCVRKTAHQSDGVNILAQAIDRMVVRFNARVAFLPFAGAADAEASTLVIRKCQSKPTLVALEGLDAVAAAIARAKVVIGIRLHALILAIRFGIPFLAVPYDPKVSGLLADIGYPLAPLWTPGARVSEAHARNLADEVFERNDELGALLRAQATVQRERAERNFAVLDALARA